MDFTALLAICFLLVSGVALLGVIGAFAMGVVVILNEAGLFAAPALYAPAGGVSGCTTLAAVIWLIGWAVLHRRWKDRRIESRRVLGVYAAADRLGRAVDLSARLVTPLIERWDQRSGGAPWFARVLPSDAVHQDLGGPIFDSNVLELVVAALPLREVAAELRFFIYERGGRVPMPVAVR